MYSRHLWTQAPQKHSIYQRSVRILLVLILVSLSSNFQWHTGEASTENNPSSGILRQTNSLNDKFIAFPWVAYAPTHYDPDAGVMPSEEDIQEDLRVLYETGFRGIVTYGASGTLAQIPRLAREASFEGVVMGIWMPNDPDETEAALAAVSHVDGYVVGNEGLFFGRYEFEDLEKAVADLQAETGKPVTVSEIVNSYFENENLQQLGDWIFPTAHPFWQNITNPADAYIWTAKTFDSLTAIAGEKQVVLKEVGLPTAGQPELKGPNGLSEYQQAEYYVRLRDSDVDFVYFEAFDQPWKTGDPVEPHWGLFQSDRTPKVIANYVEQGYPPFYVYADAGAPHNHFVPEGWMGCYQGIQMEENDQSAPYQGSSAIRIDYAAQPECGQTKWAGIYWWHPPQDPPWYKQGEGYDLRGWTKLTFWVKGAQGGEIIECKVGGLRLADQTPVDSLQEPMTTYNITLTEEWTQYTISLYRRDLSNIAGGFVWVTPNQGPLTVYFDEIRFEWAPQ